MYAKRKKVNVILLALDLDFHLAKITGVVDTLEERIALRDIHTKQSKRVKT